MAPRAEIGPARRAAYRALLRVFEDDAYADHAFRTAATGLDERDRALAQRLTFGTVQRVRTLDHAIETLGRRKVHRLDPPVRAALRLGAYQLGYVDGVPRYAAVNESVELVRAAGLTRAVAFANAVLRRLADGIDELLESLPETSAREAALKHSYPDWIAETWWRDLGEAAALELMRAQNEPAEVAVRLVRGEIEGAPDPEIRVPGSSTGSTSWRCRRAASGRRAAPPSSSGWPSVRARVSARSMSAPLPVARRRCSPATSSQWT